METEPKILLEDLSHKKILGNAQSGPAGTVYIYGLLKRSKTYIDFFYVGQTTDPEGRYQTHRTNYRACWMYVFDQCTPELASQTERYWIQLISKNHRLENIKGNDNERPRVATKQLASIILRFLFRKRQLFLREKGPCSVYFDGEIAPAYSAPTWADVIDKAIDDVARTKLEEQRISKEAKLTTDTLLKKLQCP